MGASRKNIDPNIICFTFDVEWASQLVIDDVRALLDERKINGTFFVTHAGVDVGNHERGLHPNFRRTGEIYRSIKNAESCSDEELYEHVLKSTFTFAPEARGTRSHSLFFDTSLLRIYERLGLEYDATLRLELVAGLRPFWKQHNVIEIPTYYADYFDLITQTTGFDVTGIMLDAPGMKVLDFHPNLIYINAPDITTYEQTRSFHRDPERLSAARYGGRGTRTLFIELLDYVVAQNKATATLAMVNAAARA